MFTFVIPTMWRERRSTENRELIPGEIRSQEDCSCPLKTMLEKLVCNHIVDDIIIIDNDPKNRPEWFTFFHTSSKIRLLEQEKNIYVNPAWNLGVSESKNDIICLLSDDVWFDLSILNKIHACIEREQICLGADISCYTHNAPDEILLKEITYTQESDSWLLGYGCVIFLHRKNFERIPEEMLIWYGDFWIVKAFLDKKLLPKKIFNTRINTNSASTSGEEQFSIVKQNDSINFAKILGQHWHDYYRTSINRIRNTYA